MPVEYVGLSLFICLPMAFVVIGSDQQQKTEVSPDHKIHKNNSSRQEEEKVELKRGSNSKRSAIFRQLEIVSAGILNNAVLCLFTLVVALYLNPIRLLYGAGSGEGLLVTGVDSVIVCFSF